MFILCSLQPLNYDEISGTPDYILAKRSPPGNFVFDTYLIVVAAKRDNFVEGWGQCLAEMLAVQRINNNSAQTVFGVITNGRILKFGRLANTLFTKNVKTYSIQAL